MFWQVFLCMSCNLNFIIITSIPSVVVGEEVVLILVDPRETALN